MQTSRFCIVGTFQGNPQHVEVRALAHPPGHDLDIVPAQEVGLPLEVLVDGKWVASDALSTELMVPGTAWEFDGVGRVIVDRVVVEPERGSKPRHLVLVCTSDAAYHARRAEVDEVKTSLKFPGR